jgi:acetylornithine deacetylase/succinyl-diaminopimelate desuccinylase-like protein
VAHKGFVWAEVEVSGRAAHGSRPHLGVDAIVKTGPLLTALGELDAALGERTHPLLGRGSVHASLIAGASYWADSAFIAAAGIPTVLFGPAGEGAHAAEEWVSISSTDAVARTLVGVAARVCA